MSHRRESASDLRTGGTATQNGPPGTSVAPPPSAAPGAKAPGTGVDGTRRTSRGFREDIEGLRGVAVLLVVLFHAGWTSFSGGYIGVDVFFVISGFLITGLLLAEATRAHGVALGAFWARRARRLVPALAVVLLATLGLSLVVYSPLAWSTISHQVQAAALFVSNLMFARDSQLYFAGAVSQSPVLHTWSLGVEEQFYLFWPLLVVTVTWSARRAGVSLLNALLGALALVFVGSFVLSLVLTERGSPWAFYSSPTRAWEFATGGLLAIASQHLDRLGSLSRSVLSWLGLAMIVVAAVTFDSLTPFPGTAALLPVMGAALVLATGRPRETVGASHVLATRPLRTLGRWSYSWYLWHWPLIVFAADRYPGLSTAGRTVAALVALVLAALTYRYVENPGRGMRAFRRPRNALIAGALVLAVVVGAGALVSRDASAKLHDPYLAHLLQVRDARSLSGPGACAQEQLPGVGPWCVGGDPTATQTVVLIGDSHAIQWAPAVEQAAKALGVRLIERGFAACPAINVEIAKPGTTEPSGQCLKYRDETRQLIEAIKPAAVVVSQASYLGRALGSPGDLLSDAATIAKWRAETTRFTEWVRSLGSKVLVIQDNPELSYDPVECLAKHRSVSTCSPETSDVLPRLHHFVDPEEQAYRAQGVTDFVDTSDLMCGQKRCRVQIGQVPVFSDSEHLSFEFTADHAALITDALRHTLSQPL